MEVFGALEEKVPLEILWTDPMRVTSKEEPIESCWKKKCLVKVLLFMEGADVQEQAVDGVGEVFGVFVCGEYLWLVEAGAEFAVPAGERSVGALGVDGTAIAETTGVEVEEGLRVVTEAVLGAVQA
ncbi:hypothetical protein NDU88_007641 [Pleurodeles waltl]|uniref:Uncharacterized protein n=1 Tax=Pleurodeles waltl TaxID=8319 RepID=A0AAV7QMF8_PLEWA|nr:hypothetical protein NDU88_007641 [Pleurodeles waltl]